MHFYGILKNKMEQPIYELSRKKQYVYVKSGKNEYSVLMGRRFVPYPKFDGKTYRTTPGDLNHHVSETSTPLTKHQTANDLHVPVGCTCKSWMYLGLAPVKPAPHSTTSARTLQQSRAGCKHMKYVRDVMITHGIKSIPIVD